MIDTFDMPEPHAAYQAIPKTARWARAKFLALFPGELYYRLKTDRRDESIATDGKSVTVATF